MDDSHRKSGPHLFEPRKVIVVDRIHAQHIARSLGSLNGGPFIKIEQVRPSMPTETVNPYTYDLAILGYHDPIEAETGPSAEAFWRFMLNFNKIFGAVPVVLVTDNWPHEDSRGEPVNHELTNTFKVVPDIKGGCTLEQLPQLSIILAGILQPVRKSSSSQRMPAVSAPGQPLRRHSGSMKIPK